MKDPALRARMAARKAAKKAQVKKATTKKADQAAQLRQMAERSLGIKWGAPAPLGVVYRLNK